MTQRDLFITLDFPPAFGGVARFYEQLLTVCKQREFLVLTIPAPRNTTQLPRNIKLRRRTLLWPRWVWPRWVPLLFWAIVAVKKERPRIVHVGQLLPIGTVALLLHWCFGLPYVVYVHGLDLLLAQASQRRLKLAKNILGGAERVIANSEYTRHLLRTFEVPNSKAMVFLPGTKLREKPGDAEAAQLFRREHGLEGKLVLLTIARLIQRKGIRNSLSAFASLANEFPNLVYLIAGDGPERKNLEVLAAGLGVKNRTIFLGGVDDASIPALYTNADVFVETPTSLGGTDVEGFGIVYLEAGAFGKPVIGSRVGGVPEAIQDGQTGLLVPPDDSAATAAALRRLLNNADIRQRLGEKGRTLAMREASWEKRAAPFLAWLEQFAPQNA